jgi:hypothetical protein
MALSECSVKRPIDRELPSAAFSAALRLACAEGASWTGALPRGKLVWTLGRLRRNVRAEGHHGYRAPASCLEESCCAAAPAHQNKNARMTRVVRIEHLTGFRW